MNLSRFISQRPFRAFMLNVCLTLFMANPAAAGGNGNPIARLARLFDSQLVQIEERIAWLEERLADFAPREDFPLKTGLGYRGARISPNLEDPSITLDLGAELPLQQIFLVPAQKEILQDEGIFPKRFTIEVSTSADFKRSSVVYRSGSIPHAPPEGTPVLFNCDEFARFVRLTVQEGHMREANDLFGLSEIVVISDGSPVSFAAKVSTVGCLNIENLWYPEALVDGRTPLGTWHNAKLHDLNTGDAVVDNGSGSTTSWVIQLQDAARIDRIILYPFQINRSFETSIFPESMEIKVAHGEKSEADAVFTWSNVLPGSSHMTPLVIPVHGLCADTVRVTAKRPWIMGDRKLHALSEIEVWSGGINLARNRIVNRVRGTEVTPITSLTDGCSSERRLMPVGEWLKQLRERGRYENELTYLRDVQNQLAANSELNATWGSAVLLGLTFLVPVFIVERRRLMSKNQLDQIRKRIASDLHDDIGSNLGSISLIARTARKDLVRLKGPEEIAEDLDEVETIARESSLAMRDIVWLLEREQDSIGDLVQRMRDTAGRLLREMDYRIECESTRTTAKLTLDAKRHLFLFYKEAIHNVLKHSKATRVSVRIWDEDDKLALEIVDDGIGLPTCDLNKPAKLNKLSDRASVLDGSLKIESSRGRGTHVSLLVKRSYLTHQHALP